MGAKVISVGGIEGSLTAHHCEAHCCGGAPVQVEETLGRDIPPDALPEVRQGVDTW